jgi:hypothetical protein
MIRVEESSVLLQSCPTQTAFSCPSESSSSIMSRTMMLDRVVHMLPIDAGPAVSTHVRRQMPLTTAGESMIRKKHVPNRFFGARPEGSYSNKKIERDDDSEKSHHARMRVTAIQVCRISSSALDRRVANG